MLPIDLAIPVNRARTDALQGRPYCLSSEGAEGEYKWTGREEQGSRRPLDVSTLPPIRACRPARRSAPGFPGVLTPSSRHHPAQFLQIRARDGAGPEELVLADVRHPRGDRALTRIRRDEDCRLLLQAHGSAQRSADEGRVDAIELYSAASRREEDPDHGSVGKVRQDIEVPGKFGAPGGIRTPDPRLRRAATTWQGVSRSVRNRVIPRDSARNRARRVAQRGTPFSE